MVGAFVTRLSDRTGYFFDLLGITEYRDAAPSL